MKLTDVFNLDFREWIIASIDDDAMIHCGRQYDRIIIIGPQDHYRLSDRGRIQFDKVRSLLRHRLSINGKMEIF